VLATHFTDSDRAIAVAVAHTRLGTHAGIIFDDHFTRKLLHLRFHYDLALEDVPAKYAWLDIDAPPQLAGVVGTICRSVWNHYRPIPEEGKRGGLPFAINCIASFDSAGFVKNYQFGHGFTCATMVLGIFEGANLSLIDKRDWRLRYDDLKWQWKIVGALAEHGASLAFVVSQILAVGSFRFRPEDVVAAGMLVDSRPSSLDDLEELSNVARDEIDQLPLIA
jgi:hypothetical protein